MVSLTEGEADNEQDHVRRPDKSGGGHSDRPLAVELAVAVVPLPEDEADQDLQNDRGQHGNTPLRKDSAPVGSSTGPQFHSTRGIKAGHFENSVVTRSDQSFLRDIPNYCRT